MSLRAHRRLRQLAHAAARLTGLGPRGWLLLVEAQASLLWATLLVRRHPQGELIATLAARYSDPDPEVDAVAAAREIAAALDRAARFGVIRARCLVRSIALHQLLERRGLRGSRIQVGVRMRGGAFEAHAWVHFQGVVVGDDPAFVERFSPLDGLTDRVPPLSAQRAVIYR